MRSSPVQVGTLTTWRNVSAGSYHTLSTKTDGTLWAWGQNSNGQLGDGTTVSKSSPIQVGALTNWSQPVGAWSHSVATTTSGTLFTWGRNNYGQLGDGTTTTRSSPVQIGALTTWSVLAQGSEARHTMALQL
jgi:alpha-tubulin suppressor-like RCC1 family protein